MSTILCIGRVESIQEGNFLAYRVSDLVLFGSYLSDGRTWMWRRLVERNDGQIQRRIEDERRAATCPRRADLVMELFWPIEEVLRMIRNRSGWIQLTDLDHDMEVIVSGPHRYIWRDGERVWHPDDA